MCIINLEEENDPNYSFTDCTGEYSGDCNITLEYEDSSNQSGVYRVVGVATDGSEFDQTISVPNSERVNPTKVFKYIAKKLKQYLCPNCS